MVSISVVDDSDTDMTMASTDSFDTDNILVDNDPTTDAFSEASDGAAMMDVDDENIGFDNVNDYYDDLDNDTSSDITSFAENEYSYDEIAYMEQEGAAEPEPDFIRDTFYGRANTWRLASRKCKLRVALNENRELYRAYLRSLAEWYQVLRRDALNLINLHALLAYESNGEIPMPELDNQTYWATAFRMVITNPTQEAPIPARTPNRYAVLRDIFNNHYQPQRRNAETGEALYDLPVLRQDLSMSLLARLAELFAVKAKTNAMNHLCTNIPVFLKRVWVAYLSHLRHEHNLTFRISISSMAKQICNLITTHRTHLTQRLIERIPAAIFTEVLQYFNQHTARFEQAYAGVNIARIVQRPSISGPAMLVNSLSFYIWLSLEAQPFQFCPKWTPLPLASHRIGFMPVDLETMYYIVREVDERDPAQVPDNIVRPNNVPGRGRCLSYRVFRQQDPELLEGFWESLFNIGHVEPRRCRYAVEGQGVVPPEDRELKLFNNTFETDGVAIVFHFRRPVTTRRGEYMPSSSNQVKRFPREIDVTQWRRGMYHLSKEPDGLDAERLHNFRTVFIDPGIRSLVTAVDTLEPLETPEARAEHVYQLNNRTYQFQSMFKWALQKENKNRARYAHVERQAHPDRDIPEIQEVYDMLRGHPASAPTSEGFRNYIRMLSGVHRHIHEQFNKHFFHRETLLTLFSARKSALENLANRLIGLDHRDDVPLPFFNKASKRERKAHRRRFRRPRRAHAGFRVEDNCIVAYGDGRFKPSFKGFEPIPVETFRAVLARRVMVMLIDEYRTSVVCSACDANTRQFRDRPGSVQVCREHTKRRIRRIRERAEDDGHRNNARRQLWCVDDDGHNLWPTSTCNDRQNAAGSQLSVYPLKFCDHCPVPTLWDRDNNAARNIGRIFMQYVQTGNLRSRPPSMRRPAGENVLDDAHDDEFEEEEEDEEEQALAPVME